MTADQKQLRLDALAHDVIFPYCILAAIWLVLAVLIRFAHLPDLKPELPSETIGSPISSAPAKRSNNFLLGFTAIFFAVGVEVLAGDTIGNYGQYHGLGLDVAKTLASYTLACMMLGYLAGVLFIPRFISQQRAFYISSCLGLFITALILLLPGRSSIACVALLGVANAMLWAAIWPQALKGLSGKDLARGSAVLIMGIAGGALMPLLYGKLAEVSGNQYAYWILIPAYIFLIYYSILGKKDK